MGPKLILYGASLQDFAFLPIRVWCAFYLPLRSLSFIISVIYLG